MVVFDLLFHLVLQNQQPVEQLYKMLHEFEKL